MKYTGAMVSGQDLVGQRFNRLVVLKEVERHITSSGQSARRVLCKCDCGRETTVQLRSLRSGVTGSCGCLKRERIIETRTTHGKKGTRIYSIWNGMKTRCNNKNHIAYMSYGGRGIGYDKKWEKFSGFYEDMKSGYSDKLSMDRIDNNRGYCKENCRWATQAEQMKNLRKNVHLTLNGKTMIQEEWARELGIGSATISRAIKAGKSFQWVYDNHLLQKKIIR